MTTASTRPRARDAWRLHNAGRILGDAVARFESRILELMAQAGHSGTRQSHINLTRHLDLEGTRITELAKRANITNAAMTELIDQCEALGLVARQADATDGRVRIVVFTEAGRDWLAAFGKALKKAERELVAEIGDAAAKVLFASLARYASGIQSIRVG